MNIQLPVKMLPLAPAAAKPAGFVIAILIGLALFSQKQQGTTGISPTTAAGSKLPSQR